MFLVLLVPCRDYARPLTELFQKKEHKSIAVFYTEIPFLASLAGALEEQDQNKLIKSSTAFLPGIQDFRSDIIKLKQINPDAIVAFLLPDQIAPFISQMNQFALNPVLYGTDTLTDPSLLTDNSHLVQGAIFTDIDIPEKFLSKYITKYGSTHNASFAFNSYSFAKLITNINTLKQSSSLSLIQLLKQVKSDTSCNICSYINDKTYGQYFDYIGTAEERAAKELGDDESILHVGAGHIVPDVDVGENPMESDDNDDDDETEDVIKSVDSDVC